MFSLERLLRSYWYEAEGSGGGGIRTDADDPVRDDNDRETHGDGRDRDDKDDTADRVETSTTPAGEDKSRREVSTSTLGSLTAGLFSDDELEGPEEPAEQRQERIKGEVKAIGEMDPEARSPEQQRRLESFKSGFDVSRGAEAFGDVAGMVAGPVGALAGMATQAAASAYNAFADDDYRTAGAEHFSEVEGGTGAGLAAKGLQVATGIPAGLTRQVVSGVGAADYGGLIEDTTPQVQTMPVSTQRDRRDRRQTLTDVVTQPEMGAGFSMAAFNPAYELQLMRSGR